MTLPSQRRPPPPMDRIRGFQAVRTSERHDHTPGPEEQERRVLAVLASGPFDVMEIARRADLSWQAVDETCRRLSLTNLVASVNGYTWKRA